MQTWANTSPPEDSQPGRQRGIDGEDAVSRATTYGPHCTLCRYIAVRWAGLPRGPSNDFSIVAEGANQKQQPNPLTARLAAEHGGSCVHACVFLIFMVLVCSDSPHQVSGISVLPGLLPLQAYSNAVFGFCYM